MNEPRIVLFDIETLPDLDKVMSVFPGLSNYPGLTLKASINSIACMGYKVYGEKEIHCLNSWDFKQSNVNDDKQLLIKIREVLSNADCFVTHNGKRFDLKFIQTRLLFHGLDPLPKINHIDTRQESKKHLLMFDNKLNTISKFLTNKEKLENGGWSLWCDVLKKDKKARKLMAEYCKQDVNVLYEVYKKLLPFMNQIPNYNQYVDEKICPNCGSTRLLSNGYRVTSEITYKRLSCKDCGTSCRETTKGNIKRL